MITQVEELIELYDQLPEKCIKECTDPGNNIAACDRWVDKLGLNVSEEQCIKLLEEVGAWSIDELEDDSQGDLNLKLLWVAAAYRD